MLVDRLWLGGFTGRPVAFGSLDEVLYGKFDALRIERERTDADILIWAESLNRVALESKYGERLNFPLWLVVTHFFNHQTHHRGQVHDLLSQTAVAPPQLDEFFLSQDASRRAEEMATLALS